MKIRAVLVGRLGRDPEVKTIGDDRTLASFSVAKEDYAKKNPDGTYTSHTSWVEARAWGKTGDNIAKFFKKGDQVILYGDYVFDTYETDCEKHKKLTSVQFQVSEFDFISAPKSSSDSSQSNSKIDDVEDSTTDTQDGSDDKLPF